MCFPQPAMATQRPYLFASSEATLLGPYTARGAVHRPVRCIAKVLVKVEFVFPANGRIGVPCRALFNHFAAHSCAKFPCGPTHFFDPLRS